MIRFKQFLAENSSSMRMATKPFDADEDSSDAWASTVYAGSKLQVKREEGKTIFFDWFWHDRTYHLRALKDEFYSSTMPEREYHKQFFNSLKEAVAPKKGDQFGNGTAVTFSVYSVLDIHDKKWIFPRSYVTYVEELKNRVIFVFNDDPTAQEYYVDKDTFFRHMIPKKEIDKAFFKGLLEGGAATKSYRTERATQVDVDHAVRIVSKALGIDVSGSLLGSSETTLQGKKESSGDIDIALSKTDMAPAEAHTRMMKLTDNKGSWNKGTNVGSYAVDVGDKLVQVDLMYVSDKTWAKFIYHSSEGRGSNYPGIIRNLLLMAAMRHTHEKGKDFIVKKGDEVVARASRAIKLDTGVERLFKAAKFNDKTKKFNKAMDKMDPRQLAMHVHAITGKNVKFSPDADIITDPDKVAAFLFGDGVKAKDIMTAEQVIRQIRKRADKTLVLDDAAKSIKDAGFEVPKEMTREI